MPRFRRFRFGFLSLFAAMLLAVSAGGWWKFRRDLYLEEQAILAALGKAGCAVYVRREVPPADPATPPVEAEPTVWDEHLKRIRVLSVSGDPSPDLRRRLAAMPELEMLQIYNAQPPQATPVVPVPMPSAKEVLGSAAPTLAEPRLDPASVGEPHPQGTALSEADTAKLVKEIRHAWTNRTSPERFVRVVEEESFGYATIKVVHAGDGDASLVSEDASVPSPIPGQLQISDREECCILERTENGWRLGTRMSSKLPKWNRLRPPSLDEYIFPKFDRRLDDLDHVAAAERLEGNRVRLTFRPRIRSVVSGGRGPTTSVVEQALVLDGDLDWAPVSLRQAAKTPPGSPLAGLLDRDDEEYRFERIGDYVLPVEAVGKEWRTRIAWSIDPQFEPGTFSMERYFDGPAPVRRDLPFWRWYRVGFAISAGLFAFLIGRSVVGWFRRPARKPRTDGNDPAVASTPGA